MSFRVMQNWSRFAEGDVISGGDIAELGGCVGNLAGWNPPTEIEREKLGLTSPKAVSEERIRELIARGVLHGFGDDAVFQPDTPVILQPSFAQRAQDIKAFDLASLDDAAYARNREIARHTQNLRKQ